MQRRSLLIAGSAFALTRAAFAADPDFHIGVVASVTGSFAAPTKDTFDGIDAWRKVHGIPGRNIVMETLDDETNPVNAANLFRRLAGDPKISLIYLFINSTSATAAKSFASEYKVPIISGGGADSLGNPADPWFFKVVPSNRDYMIALCTYMQRKGHKKLGILFSNDTFGQYDHSNLKDLTPKYGIQIVAEESFSADDTNFNSQLTHLRAAKADLIYSSASGRAAIVAFRQFKQLGITTPLVNTGSGISQAFFNAIGGAEKANGLMVMTQPGSLTVHPPGDTATYYNELKTALGRTPVFFNTFGYDVGLMTAAAVARSDGSRKGIRDALEALKDMPALNGPISYRPDDHTGQDSRAVAVGKLTDGALLPAD